MSRGSDISRVRKNASKSKTNNKNITKHTLFEGAFISTKGIVISKILGIIYVICFYAVVGDVGGALYGYAYTIYSLVLALSSVGLSFAIQKLISEYQTLGYYSVSDKVFIVGKRIAILMGSFLFIILFIFAPYLAHGILGDLKGGNTVEQVVFVIRVISTAILVVPILSVYRGYLGGHKYLTFSRVSMGIEKVARILVIVFGSFLCLKVFHLSVQSAVGMAVFGTTFGAIGSFLYLVGVIRSNRKALRNKKRDEKDAEITAKMIIRKIFWYAFPFIMIDIFKALYDVVDMMTLVTTLGEKIGYSMRDAEGVMGIISTWGFQFNMIITSVSLGIIASLVPNLTSSFVVGNKKDVNKKVNQIIQIIMFLIVPMTIGFSLLSEPLWILFYGPSKYGAVVVTYLVYVALVMSLFMISVTILRVLKDYKMIVVSLVSGFLLKMLLNTTLICGFNSMGLPAYYGVITATILGYFVSFIICLVSLHKKYGINYETTFKESLNVICGGILMAIVLILLRFIVPQVVASRLLNILIIILYGVVGVVVYLVFTCRTGTVKAIFGRDVLDRLLGQFGKKR